MKSGRDGIFLVGGLLLALALRTGYAVYAYRHTKAIPSRPDFYDPESYDFMAGQMIDRHAFLGRDNKPVTDREPLYPLMLASAHLVFGRSWIVGVALNIVLGLAGCWLIYWLTLELWGDFWAARLAFAMACVFPEWIYYDCFLFREPVVTVLLALWAWAWFARSRLGLERAFVVAGLSFGVLSLIRSPFIPLGAAFCALACWRIAPRLWSRTVGVFVLCAIIFQVPWALRNHRVLGRWVAGASMGGSVMYLSLLADYDHPEVPFETPLSGSDPVVREAADKGLTLSQAEPIFYRACWQIFLKRPALFWGAFYQKVVKLWRLYPNAGWNYEHPYSAIRLIGLLSNGSLTFLALAGLIVAWRLGRPADLLVLGPAVMTIVYGLFWSVTRYHTTLYVYFMPLAALALRRIRPMEEPR